MKFHKQLKVPGMSQDQIVEALKNSELEMRPMRTQYSFEKKFKTTNTCLLYTSPSPRDRQKSRMPSSA